MILQNVSGPIHTMGSDLDVNLILCPQAWRIVTRLLARLRMSYKMRNVAYRVECGQVEFFILDKENLDLTSLALQENHRIMTLWTTGEKSRYSQEKTKLAHMTGQERKRAKADLARLFGLSTLPYGNIGY